MIFKLKFFYCCFFAPSRSKFWLRVHSSVASDYLYKFGLTFWNFHYVKFCNFSFWNCIGACECVVWDCGYVLVLRRCCMCAPQSVLLIKSSSEFAWGVASLNKSCVNCVWAWKIRITTIHVSVPCASGTHMRRDSELML